MSDRPRPLDAEVETIRSGLGVELGIIAALVVGMVLLVTTRLGEPVRSTADAACLLPKMARAIAACPDPSPGCRERVQAALAACDSTPEESQSIWKAHLEAERIEGFVPRRTP